MSGHAPSRPKPPGRLALIVSGGIAGMLIPLALAATGWVLFQELRGQNAFQEAAARSYETRVQIAEAFGLLLEAETGQRGYVITGDPEFLEPWERAQAELPGALEDLRRVWLADGRSPDEVDRFAQTVDEKLSYIERTVRIRSSAGEAAALREISAGRGKAIMDAARQSADGLREREASALTARREAADQRFERAELIIFALFIALSLVLVLCAVAIYRNLASRRVLLVSAQSQAERLAAIFDGSQDSLLTVDGQGRVQGANRAACELLGAGEAALRGRDVAALIDLSALGEGSLADREARYRSEDAAIETRATTAAGATIPVAATLGAYEEDGEACYVLSFRDISRRKALEAVKDSFVSTVSHELRTPLTSISGSLDLLAARAGEENPSHQTRRLLEIAQTNSKRLIRLINDILDIEKLESGNVTMAIADVSLRELASSAIEACRGYAAPKGVRMRLTMVEEDVVVRADPDRLMQVAVNLISNAIKFSPDGAAVEVVAAGAGIEGELTVRDYGPGVPDAFRGRLFGKFAQADGARATGAGSTGLGLAISREIAERLGGRIWHEPAPGEGGASFTIALPLSHASQAAQLCEGERVDVLHVDDNPDTLRLVAQAFSGRASVRSATSLAEAGRAIEAARPDVIILDMALPGENAEDFLEENAASARPVPVVIFSALDIEPGRERRAARVFTKSRTTLGELITGALSVAARIPDESPGDTKEQACP